MIPSIYELDLQGIDPKEFLGRLTPEVRHRLSASWAWRARPGQRWMPGPEFITDYECGRGYGKNFSAAENLCDAALDPDRWGGHACIGGPDPRQVKRDCLPALFRAASLRSKAGIGPDICFVNYNDRILRFEAIRGVSLTVQWAASSDPKSFRGPNFGLVWCDEFGVWYHQTRDEAGKNAWQALLPAIRAGRDPKVIITQTPSKALEVLQLQRDAERPECPTCRDTTQATSPWRGEPGQEPWRLPRSPRPLVHPLLQTRTTEPIRTCPVCLTSVTAQVRLVTGPTLDNPHIAPSAREQARRALAGNTPAARAEFDPQGESDATPQGSLVRPETITRIHLDVDPLDADRWLTTLTSLGSERVLVFVDPAVTATDSSDDTGLVVSCLRMVQGTSSSYDQVVALQDGTVRPADVQGAPSATWAPKAVWLAMCWGAAKICVETNQGGEEVLASLRGQLGQIPDEDTILHRIAAEMGRPPIVRGQPSLMPTVRRMRQTGITLIIEAVHRRSPKPARWGWFGESAARKEQAICCLSWLDGERHWLPALAQASAYEPARTKVKERKDRFDAVVGGAQVLLGVRETKQGVVKTEQQNWMQQGVERLFGR